MYHQVHGTAMGSPVSVVVANLVMEELEHRAIDTIPGSKPPFWKRYVDDTFTAIRLDLVQKFFKQLNSVVNTISFTYKVEENSHLPFLDVMVHGRLSTSVYRKKTHANQYLSFDSHHPSNHKSAAVHTLLKWADRLIIFG